MKKDNKLLGLFKISFYFAVYSLFVEGSKMNRGNNFHKTQQYEEEKIIKGRKKGLEGKVIPNKKEENILFNIRQSISEMLSTFRAIASALLLRHEIFFHVFVWK